MDLAKGTDTVSLQSYNGIEDFLNWKASWKVEKWHNSENHRQNLPPDEVIETEKNGLLNAGITELLKLLGTTGATQYNNANARMYVGNSSAAFSAAHTDLQGASKTAKVMDASYPQVTAQTITWRSTYGDAEANHAWLETGVLNGAPPVSVSVILLNRKVQDLGTKTTGTWVLTLNITVS